MPQFNWLAPRTGVWGNQLETHRHIGPGKGNARQWAGKRLAERYGDIGEGIGSAVAMGGAYAARRFGHWYYPSETINVSTRTRAKYMPRSYTKTVTEKKKKRKQKTCCRYIKGKKVCKPEFCSKKKYWY